MQVFILSERGEMRVDTDGACPAGGAVLAYAHMMNVLEPYPGVFLCEQLVPRELSPEEVIRMMAAAAAGKRPELAAQIAGSAMAREAQESTYVGRGLAVPHARLADGAEPFVCVAGADGVDWRGGRATLIALLALPETRPELHLQYLGVLARYVSAHKGEPAIDRLDLAAALSKIPV